MNEALNDPIQMSVGYGRISATWIDGTAIWLSDYYSHQQPDLETQKLARQKERLAQAFKRYKLLDPTVEIFTANVDTDDATRASKIGGQLLRVTTLLMPYIDPCYLRPIVELRQPAPSERDVERSLVIKGLSAGGQAISDTFGASIIDRH